MLNTPNIFSPKKFSTSRPVLKSILVLATASLMTIPQISSATNGMNMEGYGAISTGMGGAAMAYDNGTGAVMSNPATLGLMEDGESKLEVGVGNLRPAITSESPSGKETSSADSFFMPAVGWAQKKGRMSYGVGIFSQGGMGTEYDNGKFMTGNGPNPTAPNAYSGQTVRSEVGVGRLVIPLTYDVTNNFTMGGSVDFVWGGMDIQMDLSGLQFADLVGPSFGGNNQFGTVSGSLINTFGGFVAPGLDPDGGVNWGRVDFSDSSDFTGSAGSTGLAGKLGAVYKFSPTFRLGATYQSKTSLGDMKSSDANVSFSVNANDAAVGTVGAARVIDLKGKVRVKDFQWPEIIGIGVAFEATQKLLLVADYKRLNWSKVMQDFSMVFTADAGQADATSGAQFGGTQMDMTLYQDWKDQNVLLLGAGYKFTEAFTLRGGLNLANNPVPDEYLNPLFPAIVKNHITLGFGYGFTKAHAIDFSLAFAPAVDQTTDYGQVTNAGTGAFGDKIDITHGQTNWQLVYSFTY